MKYVVEYLDLEDKTRIRLIEMVFPESANDDRKRAIAGICINASESRSKKVKRIVSIKEVSDDNRKENHSEHSTV